MAVQQQRSYLPVEDYLFGERDGVGLALSFDNIYEGVAEQV